MRRLVELSHEISDGLVTYPGLPAPQIDEYLTREASRARYAPGTEFSIGRIKMVANTGTYLDTQFHRFADGFDLAGLKLEQVADLEAVLVPTDWTGWMSAVGRFSSTPAGTATGRRPLMARAIRS